MKTWCWNNSVLDVFLKKKWLQRAFQLPIDRTMFPEERVSISSNGKMLLGDFSLQFKNIIMVVKYKIITPGFNNT